LQRLSKVPQGRIAFEELHSAGSAFVASPPRPALSRRSECSGPCGGLVVKGMRKSCRRGYRFPPGIIRDPSSLT
jgi:hypothetical protein